MKKILIILTILICAFLAVSAANASDIVSDDNSVAETTDLTVATGEVTNNNDNYNENIELKDNNLILEDNNLNFTENVEEIDESESLKNTKDNVLSYNKLGVPVSTWSELSSAIDANESSIILTDDINLSGLTLEPVIIQNSLTLDGNGKSIFACDARWYLFDVKADSTIKNLIFRDNQLDGAAIFAQEGGTILTFDNCTFQNNSDGIMQVSESTLIVNNSHFINNSNEDYGGGVIYLDCSNLEVYNCEFIENHAGDRGGVIYTSSLGQFSSILAINSNFTNNSATYGGAIYCECDANLTFIACDFSQNFAYSYYHDLFNYVVGGGGGAIYSGPRTNLSIANSTFNQNSAYACFDESDGNVYGGLGGAICSYSNGNIDNSSFINNTGWNGGAIVYGGNESDLISINNCSFIENKGIDFNHEGQVFSGLGGAIHANSTIELAESEFSRNTATEGLSLYLTDTAIVNAVNTILEDNDVEKENGAKYRHFTVPISDLYKGFSVDITVTESTGFEGDLKLILGSEEFPLNYENGQGTTTISPSLDLGTYDAYFVFNEAGNGETSIFLKEINVLEKIYNFTAIVPDIAKGHSINITVSENTDFEGTVNITIGNEVFNIPFSNGYGCATVIPTLDLGTYDAYLRYQVTGHEEIKSIFIRQLFVTEKIYNFTATIPDYVRGDSIDIILTENTGFEGSANVRIGDNLFNIPFSNGYGCSTVNPNLAVGTYETYLIYQAIDQQLPVSLFIRNLTVSKRVYNFTSYVPDFLRGDTIEINVTESTGFEGTVKVLLGNETYIVPFSGGEGSLSVAPSLDIGTYNASLLYQAVGELEFTSIPLNQFTVDYEAIKYNILNYISGQVAIEIMVYNPDGEEITGPDNVTLSLDGVQIGSIKPFRVYKNTDLEEGDYIIIASYGNRSKEISLTVVDDPVIPLNERIDNLTQALNETQENLTAANERIGNLSSVLNDTQENLTAANERIGNLSSVLNDTQGNLTAANERIGNLTNEINTLNSTLNQTREELAIAKQNIDSLNTQVEEINGNLNEKIAELIVANERIDNLTGQVTKLNSTLNDKIAELIVANERIDNLTGQVTKLNSTLNDKIAELDAANADIASLNATVTEINSTLNEKITELDAAKADISQLNSTVTELNNSLNDKIDQLNKDEADIASLNATVTEINSTLNERTAELNLANEKIDNLTKENAEINSTLNKKVNDLSDYIASIFDTLNTTIDLRADEEKVNINLKDSKGQDIAGAELEVLVDDVLTPVNPTDENGNTSVPIEGNATVKVSYIDTNNVTVSQSIEVINTVNTIYISPNRTATKIHYQNMSTTAVAKVDGRIGEYFEVNLTDDAGNPLENKTVYIGFNGVVYTRTTNSTGGVRLQINLGYEGDYTFAMGFLGDDNYTGSFEVAVIKVAKHSPKLTASSKTYKASAKTKAISATFKSANNKAITDKKITFTVNGKTYSATTNSKGVATVNVSLSTKGTYTCTAKYAGDKMYKATSTSFKLQLV